MTKLPMLTPFCPFCHKAFFTAAPAGVSNKTCRCKRGRSLIKDWMSKQKLAMDTLSDPLEALQESEISNDVGESVE